ncbi:MAG: ribbon-helix-helix protein, CopG family [Thermoleophilia bacterium]
MLGRTTKVMTISLPPETASLVDRLANAEKKNKSQLIREAIDFYDEMRAEKEWQELRALGRATAKKFGIKSDKDIERIIHEVRGV